jgi:hypothetical protein
MASLVSPSLSDPILVLKTFLDTIYNMTGDVPLKHLETYIIDTGTSCASWNLMEPHGTSLHFQAVSFSGPMVVGSSFSRQLSLNHVSRNNSKTIIFKRCQKHTQPAIFFWNALPSFPRPCTAGWPCWDRHRGWWSNGLSQCPHLSCEKEHPENLWRKVIIGVLWVKQCHKPPIWEWFIYTTYLWWFGNGLLLFYHIIPILTIILGWQSFDALTIQLDEWIVQGCSQPPL